MFQKNVSRTLALLLGVFVLSFLIGLVVLAWTEPTVSPPGGNVSAPINVSNIPQSKAGGLGLGYLLVDSGTNLAAFSGKVVIGAGAVSPIGDEKVYVVNDKDLMLKLVRSGATSPVQFKLKTDNTLIINAQNSDVLTIKNTNVGIGTTSPSTKLHVLGQTRIEQNAPNLQLVGSDSVYQEFYPQGSAKGRYGWLGYGNAGTEILTIMNQRASRLDLGTNSVVGLSIISNGNVGIATSTPEYKLDVYGDINLPATGFLRIAGNAGSSGQVLARTATGMAWQAATGGGVGGSGTADFIPRFKDATTLENSLIKEQWYAPLAEGKRFVIIGEGANAQAGTPRLQIFNKNDEILALVRVGALGMPIAQTTLRIGTDKATVISDLDYDYLTLKNGNVGIGTKNPLEKLHIKTSPASYRHGVLIDVENPFSNAGPALRLAGTGTYTTPTTLEIRRLDTENKEISFSLMNNAYNNGFKIKMPPNSNDVYFDLFGLGGDGEIIIKRDTGYVGIGTYTSNPTAKLDINGQIRIRGGGPGPNKVLTSDAAGLASWQPGGAGGGIGGSGIDNYIPRWLGTNSLENSVIYQTDAGNVGIGTTNPLGMLGIDGFSTTTGPPGSVLSDHPVGITMLNTSNAIGSYTSITNARNDYGPLGINVVRSGIFFRTMDQLYAGQIDFYTYDGLWTEGEGVRMSIDRKGYVGIGTESPDAVLEIVSDLGYFGADYLADSTLRLKKEKGVAGSVELFPAVGSSGAPKYNGLQICRTVSSSAICLGAWRSPIQGGGNIDCTLSETGVRALCADFGD